MITQLDRYILRQLLASLLAVTTALVALIWLTQSLRFVELVVNRGLSLRVFLQLTGLLVPNFVAVILPITTFMAVQFFVYQRLSGDRELTVMRSAGLSQWALSRPALIAAGLAMAAGFALNVWVVPASNSAFKEFQFELRNKVAAFLLQEGVFTAISDQLTVYIRSRDTDGTLHGIMVEDDRQSATHATILSQSGRLVADGDTPRVLLEDGSRQVIDGKTGRLDVLTFAEDTVDLASGKGADAQRARDDSEMSLQRAAAPQPRRGRQGRRRQVPGGSQPPADPAADHGWLQPDRPGVRADRQLPARGQPVAAAGLGADTGWSGGAGADGAERGDAAPGAGGVDLGAGDCAGIGLRLGAVRAGGAGGPAGAAVGGAGGATGVSKQAVLFSKKRTKKLLFSSGAPW